MLKPSVLAVAAALVLSACGSVTAPSPQLAGVYDAVVADPRRPADEVARDPFRHPADMLAFARIEPGDKVADIRPGAGYFTRLFAPVVGDMGKVYAFVPNRTAERENPRADALVAVWPNVVRVNGDLNTLSFPEPLDVVWMSQEYHDFHIPAFNTDVALMNRAIFNALKPGGLFVVVDHSGRPGTGHTEVQTLHRIEGASLRAEVEAAGFVFDGETTVLANPADDRTVNVFDEAIRGRTDQFVYRFRKPG
ncbi:class I SAM-dependent methyltransferase [Brevundimonas sp. LjRoot202]|uniref:class I SAM-dependent methyltransferase n=1 Tax=Brevundimonas sp. LjRoot202 TaxID=3342281 RepID=UPI003ECC1F08